MARRVPRKGSPIGYQFQSIATLSVPSMTK